MNEFYTVKDEKVIEIEVEKSKFIGILIPFFNKDNIPYIILYNKRKVFL